MDLGKGIRSALSKITGASALDEEEIKAVTKELQKVLITNDVNVRLVMEFCKKVESRALKEKRASMISMKEHIVQIVYEELVVLLGGEKFEPKLEKHNIMVLGLFGSGKTTSCGKLASFYKSKGLKTALVACDVHRPAAFEQLKQISEQVGVNFLGSKGASAEQIALEALKQRDKYDVMLFDTAGRSAFDEELAQELKNLNKIIQAEEKFLVVSADIGQVAGKQAAQFHDSVGLTGVLITKMDGSGKGGGALSAVSVSNSRVCFIGTGEKMRDLEVFDAKSFVSRLVGFADLSSLLEKVKEVSGEEELQKAMEEGRLDYETFMVQMRAMKKMGSLGKIMQMMGMYDVPAELVEQSEEKMKRFEAMVNSMTPAERRDPKLMKQRGRQERVARGAGASNNEVRELISKFEHAQKLVKKMGKNRGFMKKIGQMMGGGF